MHPSGHVPGTEAFLPGPASYHQGSHSPYVPITFQKPYLCMHKALRDNTQRQNSQPAPCLAQLGRGTVSLSAFERCSECPKFSVRSTRGWDAESQVPKPTGHSNPGVTLPCHILLPETCERLQRKELHKDVTHWGPQGVSSPLDTPLSSLATH